MHQTLELQGPALAIRIADLIRSTRRLVGWSQRELARRAGTSQATVWRIERADAHAMDVAVLGRLFEALGLRVSLQLEGRHLGDRLRQRDVVHARMSGALATWLDRHLWAAASEVEIGHGGPRGWIDLLAFRERDRALLIGEMKSDVDDAGATQRSLAFYEREAFAAARRLGWRPRRAHVALFVLDSLEVAERLEANRHLLRGAFPVSAQTFATWMADPAAPAPNGWAVVAVDPRRRGRPLLRPTVLDGRRAPAAYRDYADAARVLIPRV